MRIQVTVDCHDPHEMAHFWAQVLGYEVGHNDEFVRHMLDEGQVADDDVVEVRGHLQFKDGATCEDPEGLRPRMYFQLVPEAKTTKNRLHLDLQIDPDASDAEVERIEALGATRLHDGRQGPHTWVTMADVEGNEFCVS